MDRRDFLKATTLGVAGLGLAACATSVSQPLGVPGVRPGQRPKNIIFMCSDGMSQGVVSLTEQFAVRAKGRRTTWARLLEDKAVTMSLMETYSLTSLVTDSAAAASAWGTGRRVINGAVNEYPDGTKLTHIGKLVKDSGRGMGLVTTTTDTHATPAGFAAYAPSRGMEAEIAPQYRDVVDVILGGGNRVFDPSLRNDGVDLYGQYRTSGYTVARTRDQMKAAVSADKLLGVFYDSHLPYTIDHNENAEFKRDIPTLAEMTRVALDKLSRNPNGFLLQVEGGRVDHAAHGNDFPALVQDQLAFDDAIEVAVDFARRRGDTLVIVTSDHANSNPGLTFYDRSVEMFDNIAKVKGTRFAFEDHVRKASNNEPNAAAVSNAANEIWGFEINDDDAQILADTMSGNPPRPINADMRGGHSIYGQVLGNYIGVHFMATSHTEDYVLFTALGPGQEHFEGLFANTKCYDVMTDLFGISHRNPAMSPDEARRQSPPVGTPPMVPLF